MKRQIHVKYVIIQLFLRINPNANLLTIQQIVLNIQEKFIVVNVTQVIDICQINI